MGACSTFWKSGWILLAGAIVSCSYAIFFHVGCIAMRYPGSLSLRWLPTYFEDHSIWTLVFGPFVGDWVSGDTQHEGTTSCSPFNPRENRSAVGCNLPRGWVAPS